jgi:hypothetical protein
MDNQKIFVLNIQNKQSATIYAITPDEISEKIEMCACLGLASKTSTLLFGVNFYETRMPQMFFLATFLSFYIFYAL